MSRSIRPRRTHAEYLDAMRARLAAADLPELAGLTTRDPADFALALLDAWATAADVLSFYDERITAELFLGTATERRSLVELARLVGYTPRPGLAATTHLAFTAEVGAGAAEVPAGTRVQNVPVPGRTAQAYETSEPLAAHEQLNRLGLRLRRPQRIAADDDSIWLRGTATGLRPDDGVLIDVAGQRTFRRVQSVDVDHAGDRTRIWLIARPAPRPPAAVTWETIRRSVAGATTARPGTPRRPEPVGPVRDGDVRQAALGRPELAPALYGALGDVVAVRPAAVTVYALRVTARVFGHNATRKPRYTLLTQTVPDDAQDWIDWDQRLVFELDDHPHVDAADLPEEFDRVHLDRVYNGIPDGSVVVFTRPDAEPLITGGPATGSGGSPSVAVATTRAAYGLAGPSTLLFLGRDGDVTRTWFRPNEQGDVGPPSMTALRGTVVHTAAEPLELADEPFTTPVRGIELELDGVYAGLAPGRLLAVSGERRDLPVPGVVATEIVRIGEVVHLAARSRATARPGDRNRTLVVLDRPLRHAYVRDTVVVAGNVVAATQGETKAEVLGSGDATVPGQRFALRSAPLTHVSAATPSGAAAALVVRVDDVEWPLRATPVGLGPDDRGYLLSVDDAGTAAVVGLDGRWGRRFPSGSENVRARYRAGLGRAGNVDAGAITLLATKPLGVGAVSNPVPATGGADPESDDDLRRNVAVPLKALDRLVSVPDYADFARAFAGIGKATADRLVVGGRPMVVVTVAGADDAPIAEDAELRVNLARALRRFGDPTVGVRVVVRERLVVRLHLEVTIDPDRDWPVVGGQVRTALGDALSFDRRDLGQDVVGSEILAAAHRVPGVRGCRIATLTTEPPPPDAPDAGPQPPPGPRIVVLPARGGAVVAPAQFAYLAPELPDYLVLTRGGDR